MELPRPSTLGWAGLIAGIAAYDYLCPQGETLSEGFDHLMETKTGKVVAIGAVALTGAHLLNLLPDRLDIYHGFGNVLQSVDEAMDVWGDEQA